MEAVSENTICIGSELLSVELSYPKGFRTVSSSRHEATGFPQIHGIVKSAIFQSMKN